MGNGGSAEMTLTGMGIEIDDFACKYIGSVPVKSPTGNDVCQNAVSRIFDLRTRERAVTLKITTNGVYIFDAKTGDVLKETAIGDVSFVAQNNDDDRVISFFENDIKNRVITCHTFRVSKEAHQIPLAINEAFEIMNGKREAPAAPNGKLKRKRSSKKEAMKASNATTGRKVDKGDELYTFKGLYIGTVNVSKPKGDEVTQEAIPRIQNLKAKPVSCTLTIYDKAMVVEDLRGNEICQCMIRDVSFAKLSSDKRLFTFIIHDRRLDRMMCSALNVEPLAEGVPSIRRCIDGAQKKLIQAAREAQEEKAMQQILDGVDPNAVKVGKEKEQETGRIIGVFEATLLGATPVPDLKGEGVVNEAVKNVLKLKTPPEGVFIQVATEGIRTIESLTHETLSSFVIKDISLSTVAGKHKDLFAFIEKDDGLGLINCHVFSCAGERAFDIATAFGDAFKAFAEEQKKTGGNPFKPYGERTPPQGDLFKKQVHRIDLLPRKAIGAGQFGQVYLAEQTVADGEGEHGTNKSPRAVKMLRGGASDLDREEFVHEAEVMLELECDQLVRLIGVSMQQKPWLMVLEFLQFGDLRHILRGCSAKGLLLSFAEQLMFGTQVARGMSFMASRRFLHMDLAARNVLVGRNNLVKVADFGLTKRLPAGKDFWKSEKVIKLPVKWCAIESLDDRIFSEASDVWSFGVVLWEIMSYGQMPYGQLKTQEVQRRVREGLRLDRPPDCPMEYYDVCKECWRVDPLQRPKFATLTKELATYLRTNATGNVRDIGASLASVNSRD